MDNMVLKVEFDCSHCKERVETTFDSWDLSIDVDNPGCTCCGPTTTVELEVRCPKCDGYNVKVIRN